MAVITPNSDVILLKVPIEMDNNNQLTFANATAQYNYFNGLTGKRSFDNYTYLRKDNTIRVGALVDDLYGYNYVMYRNTNYSNKWFYAFITNMEYISDSVTALTIKTDTWQTWQFDLTFKKVLVEREHVNDDTIGKHTYPEDLELGEIKANGSTVNFGGGGGTIGACTVIEVTQLENNGQDATLSYEWDDGSTTRTVTPRLNGITRGTTPLVVGDFDTNSQDSVSSVVKAFNLAGLSEAIVSVYMLPKSYISTYHKLSLTANYGSGSVYSSLHIVVPDSSSDVISLGNQTFTRPSTLDGYTPKNNKMYCWPFCYFNISNNAGNCQPFRYEDFSSTITFNTEGAFGISGATKAIPQNYLGVSSSDNAIDFSVNGAKYPVGSWKSDSYTNWLTQNGVNMEREQAQSVFKGAVQGVGAMAGLLGAASAIGSPISIPALMGLSAAATVSPFISTIKEQIKAKTQANMTPDQAGGNIAAGDYLWAKYRSPFTYMPMSVKAEYAKIIDAFFSAYGYEVNEVKTPNITGRTNWNYVKTVGCYIQADIPQDDLEEIKSMFDKGITFWHNPLTFMDYSQSNAIVV